MTALLLAGILLASGSGCSSESNLITDTSRPRQLVATLTRAESPNANQYLVRVRLAPSPAVEKLAGIPNDTVGGMVSGPAGTLWAVTMSATQSKILRIDAGGNVSTFVGSLRELRDIDRDSAGSLYTASASLHRVYRVDPDSSVATIATGFQRPTGVALSPDESTLYVANTDGDDIVRIDLGTGTRSDLVTASSIFAPRTLAFDPAGVLYVGSEDNALVLAIDVSGPEPPGGYAVDTFVDLGAQAVTALHFAAGVLYVAADNRIFTVAPDGNVSRLAGSPVQGRRDADPGSLARFIQPLGIALDPASQMAWIADSGRPSTIRRVLFSRSGESGDWLPEYGDADTHIVDLTAWTFSLDTGERIDVHTTNAVTAGGSLVVGVAEDRLSILGLVKHDVWVQMDVYRFL